MGDLAVHNARVPAGLYPLEADRGGYPCSLSVGHGGACVPEHGPVILRPSAARAVDAEDDGKRPLRRGTGRGALAQMAGGW